MQYYSTISTRILTNKTNIQQLITQTSFAARTQIRSIFQGTVLFIRCRKHNAHNLSQKHKNITHITYMNNIRSHDPMIILKTV